MASKEFLRKGGVELRVTQFTYYITMQWNVRKIPKSVLLLLLQAKLFLHFEFLIALSLYCILIAKGKTCFFT